MSVFAVLATGPSMSQQVADSVRGRCSVVAVSNAYQLAPWADHLASQDAAWWREHPEALSFAGKRWSGSSVRGVARVKPSAFVLSSSNSGLLGLEVARLNGAAKILLLGFDMGGSHYFGAHPEPLKNTTPSRFEVFKRQFAHWGRAHKSASVLNCTAGSALDCFPFSTLEDALC